MNLVSNENNIEKKWNQGGVLGRSPAGCTLGIFLLHSEPHSLNYNFGKGGGGFDYKSFFPKGDIYTYKTFFGTFRLFLFLKKMPH